MPGPKEGVSKCPYNPYCIEMCAWDISPAVGEVAGCQNRLAVIESQGQQRIDQFNLRLAKREVLLARNGVKPDA